MNKAFIILLAFIFLFAISAHWHKEAQRMRQAMVLYQHNNEILLRRLKNSYAEKKEVDERLHTLEKAAETTKNQGGFDWNMSLPADNVTLLLRKD